ncbi:MAG: thioredoxin TrxC [Psychromonas sp.]|nr:thioredoxin TrxC [Psychromonas sp.]
MSTFNTRCPSCKAMNKVPTARISEVAICGKCQSALFDGAPIEGTEANLAPLLSGSVPVVVDFWAPWCNPCRSFSPTFKEVAKQRNGKVRFVKVNTEENKMIAAKYQIRSIPTIMVFKNAQRVDMINGALSKKQFEAWLNKALQK